MQDHQVSSDRSDAGKVVYLPAREYELAALMARGKTTIQAACLLHISRNTAQNALSVAYRRCRFPLGSGPKHRLIEMFRLGQIQQQIGQGKEPEMRPGEHPYRVEPRRTKLSADERHWNEVYERKFADPDYYAHGPEIRCRSALADL